MSSTIKPPIPGGRVQVQLPANLQPTYSNFALITNSPSEIVIDLAQIMPQIPDARVQARIIMTPLNAKLFSRALSEHLARFEAQHGEIVVPDSSSLADHLFKPPSPPGPENPPR